MQCKQVEFDLGNPRTVNMYSVKKRGEKDQFVKVGVGDLWFDVNVFVVVKHCNAVFQ